MQRLFKDQRSQEIARIHWPPTHFIERISETYA